LRMFFNFCPFDVRAPSTPAMRARRLHHRQGELGRTVSVRCGMGSSVCSAGTSARRPLGDHAVRGPTHAQVRGLNLFAPDEELLRTVQSDGGEVISAERRVSPDNEMITTTRNPPYAQVSGRYTEDSGASLDDRFRESNHGLFVSWTTRKEV
jgi:hypothetical protein